MSGMESSLTIAILGVLGLFLGSFAGAQVWRLRSRQLVEDVREGEEVDEKEYAALLPLAATKLASDRSRCLACSTTLAWYDLIPLFSWMSTGGKCRYCKKPIGLFEPLIEAGVSLTFIFSYLLWPMSLENITGVLSFSLWLVAVVLLAILFAYDLKWFLLPDLIVFPLIGVGGILSAIRMFSSSQVVTEVISLGVSIVLLSGLYYVLWRISNGKWVGFGDVKLGLALALILGDWRLALLTLFLANFLGTLIVLPGMIAGRIKRKSHVPFGPLLIAGMIIAMLVGDSIIDIYASLIV